jgi:hypothetical protein
MTSLKLMIFFVMIVIGALGYVLISSGLVNAQTPTTTDLPATIGNESTSDMGLTNNSLPAQNTSIIYAPPPL